MCVQSPLRGIAGGLETYSLLFSCFAPWGSYRSNTTVRGDDSRKWPLRHTINCCAGSKKLKVGWSWPAGTLNFQTQWAYYHTTTIWCEIYLTLQEIGNNMLFLTNDATLLGPRDKNSIMTWSWPNISWLNKRWYHTGRGILEYLSNRFFILFDTLKLLSN